MKCPNCAADYDSHELTCPFCDSPNPRGVLWYHQREGAKAASARQLALLPALKRIAWNRLLNLTLLVEVALIVLLVAGVFVAAFTGAAATDLTALFRQDSHKEELVRLYQEERFDELYQCLDEYDLFGEEYYEYSQMALFHYQYRQFTLSRMRLDQAMSEQDVDAYDVEAVLQDIHDLMRPNIPAYPDMTENNAEHTMRYAKEARAYALGVLGLTTDELVLLESESYLPLETRDLLTQSILTQGKGGAK